METDRAVVIVPAWHAERARATSAVYVVAMEAVALTAVAFQMETKQLTSVEFVVATERAAWIALVNLSVAVASTVAVYVVEMAIHV